MAVSLNWPEGVPYEPLEEGWTIPQFYDQQLESQMDAGTARRRERFTINYRRQALSILMAEAEMKRFEDWLINQARRGTQRFNMPVWNFGGYDKRVVLIVEGPTVVPHGFKDGVRAYRVQMTIASEEA